MNVQRKQQGFTLIELMIVIAILAILIAIALPAYQNYSIRTSNSECLSVISSARASIADAAQSVGGLENVTVGNAGFDEDDDQFETERCTDFAFAEGAGTEADPVTIAIESTGDAGTTEGTFTLAARQTSTTAPIEWTCTSNHENPLHVPASCRGDGD